MWGWFRQISWQLAAISERIEEMAGTVDDLKAEITKLQQTESDTAARVQAALASLQATIDDLKAHPAAVDLTDEIASLETINTDLGQIAPAPAPPAPGP